MKVLIATAVIPIKKNKLVRYIENIMQNIKTKMDSEIFWLVYQPDHIISQKMDDGEILDIHDFETAIEVLKKIKPDCVIANPNTREPINYSLTIASKYLKIPLVFYYLNDRTPILGNHPDMTYSKNFFIILRNFFSNKVATDSSDEKRSMRRGKFFYYKNKFLFKTRKSIGMNYFNATKLFISDLVWYFRYKKQFLGKNADLNLCSNNSLYEFLRKIGIDSTKISITGSPFWDKIYEKVKSREKQHAQKKNKIKVLILTGSLVEHGLWTVKERKNYLENIFSELMNDEKISFALKIHPASENKKFYENFLSDLKINAKVYQDEDFWDIINEYDLVLSYGFSTIHTECAYGGIKMILLDVGWNFKRFALVNEAISSGFFLSCKKFDKIKKSVLSLYEKDVVVNNELITSRENMSYKFDGKAGERAADAIISLCKNKES